MSPSGRTECVEASVLCSDVLSKFLLTSHKCDWGVVGAAIEVAFFSSNASSFVSLPPLVGESGGRLVCLSVLFHTILVKFKFLNLEKNQKCVSNRCFLRLVAAFFTPRHCSTLRLSIPEKQVRGLHLLGGAFRGPH